MDAGVAFSELWADHDLTEIGAQRCPVPSLAAQRVLLVLHSARSRGAAGHDIDLAWQRASDDERTAARALVGRLDAALGFAAGNGELELFKDHPEYHLWKSFAVPRRPVDEWVGRLKAAGSVREAARVLGRAVVLNTDHLAMELGHRPSLAELTSAHLRRIRRALGQQEGD